MVYFIVNETSRTGKGKELWREVRQMVEESGIAFKAYLTKYEGHATEMAAKICEVEADDICLIVMGGDGTMNEVINGMSHFDKVRVGIIPNGSGNDFKRGLDLPKSAQENWELIQSKIAEGKSGYTAIDLGQVSWNGCEKPRLFGISAGVGLDAIVCKKALQSKLKKKLNQLHLGKLTYVFLTIHTLFSMDTADAECIYHKSTGDEQVDINQMIFSAAMNMRAEGGGVPMAPDGNPRDGQLSCCSAYGIPKWRTFFCLPLLMQAKHEKLKGFTIENSESITMKLSKPMTLHADGEYCGEVEEVTFTSVPEKLRMLM